MGSVVGVMEVGSGREEERRESAVYFLFCFQAWVERDGYGFAFALAYY